MSYRLTLTSDERSAIDWVGYRYRHGDELYKLLWVESEPDYSDYRGLPADQLATDGIEWSDLYDITFIIPEHVAWTMREIIEEDNGSLACFADELVSKLWHFAASIV